VLGSQLLGKPAHREGARRRLGALSGQIHQVLSGVAVLDGGEERTAVATTAVTFRRLSAQEIAAYVATGEWEGRAGGYAVQGFGSSLIARIEGDLSNVIGLPLPLVAELLDGLQDDSQTVS
jgi:septum formation protein